MKRSRAPVLVIAFLLGGCAYFNSMYNAQRHFSDAERAARRGDESAARSNYGTAITKAATSLRAHPHSRWADDALYLIGRARFELQEYEAARAALERAVATSTDRQLRAGARTYLGASAYLLGDPALAVTALDSAIAVLSDDSPLEGRARLWRARAHIALGDPTAAFQDLAEAARQSGPVGVEADLETARQAIATADSTRLRQALSGLFARKEAGSYADSIAVLADRAATTWSPTFAYTMVAPVAQARWSDTDREQALLGAARLAANAGDTAAATATAERLARNASTDLSNKARLQLARWQLEGLTDPADLEGIHATLLPAYTDPDARRLITGIRTLDVLLDVAHENGRPLALFAAAELARDTLHARSLAVALFTEYADRAPDDVWAAKALLAAAQLAPPARADSLRQRLAREPDNVYVRALTGREDARAFQSAEARLDQTLGTLGRAAQREARQRDVSVTMAVARMDSLQAELRADSVRTVCTQLLDSLALKGIRADSARSACLRSDSTRLARVLTMDTLLLADSARLRADSLRLKRGRDTTRLRLPFAPAGRRP